MQNGPCGHVWGAVCKPDAMVNMFYYQGLVGFSRGAHPALIAETARIAACLKAFLTVFGVYSSATQ